MSVDIRLARQLIAHRIESINTIEDLAALLYITPEGLRKAFRKKVGTSLAQYIRNVKIDRARRLLKETGATCAEICYAVGWRPDSGARTFKREMGMTMKQYRNAGGGNMTPEAEPRLSVQGPDGADWEGS